MNTRAQGPRAHGAGALSGLYLLIAMALLTGSTGCKNAQGDDEQEASLPVSVQTQTVVPREARALVKATGTVEARSDVTVVSESAGTIKKVMFELGDEVQEGQGLVKLDRKLQRMAVRQAAAQLEQAGAAEELSLQNEQRMEQLASKGSASQAELDQASMQAKSAVAARKMAKVALEQAQYALTKTTVTSPIDGRVTLKMVSRGETLAPGSPVAQVTDLSSLKVVVGLTEREVADLVVDQPVLVTSSVNPDVRSTGRIAAIGYKAVGPTRAFPVEVWIQEYDERLHPGMTVEIEVEVEKLPEAILVHVNDLFEEDGKSFVWVVDQGKAARRWVQQGRKIDEKVVILSGLEQGDRIVVTGGDLLHDGAAVADTSLKSEDGS